MKETRRPSFAGAFPRTPDLDAVVDAFARGDYATVRRQATRLEQASPDEAVRRGARSLIERTRPDPRSIALLVIAACLVLAIGGWWIVREMHKTGR